MEYRWESWSFWCPLNLYIKCTACPVTHHIYWSLQDRLTAPLRPSYHPLSNRITPNETSWLRVRGVGTCPSGLVKSLTLLLRAKVHSGCICSITRVATRVTGGYRAFSRVKGSRARVTRGHGDYHARPRSKMTGPKVTGRVHIRETPYPSRAGRLTTWHPLVHYTRRLWAKPCAVYRGHQRPRVGAVTQRGVINPRAH